MPQLVMLIVDDPSKIEDVLNAWVETGVTGATIIDSFGLGHIMPGETRDDLPLFPSLADIVQGREEHNRLLISVAADTLDVERLVAVTEALVGRLSDPNTGIMFTVPVGRVWGLQPPRK